MMTDQTQANQMVYGYLAGCGAKSQVTLVQISKATGLTRATARTSIAALSNVGAICLEARTSGSGAEWYAIIHMHPYEPEGGADGG